MAKTAMIFGNIYILKKNPWLSGKFKKLVEKGLAKPKKDYILSKPVPWFFDVSALSKAQVAQIIRFSKVAHETRGQDIETRITRIKAEASGPTGLAKPRVRPELPRLGRVITVAKALGVAVPPELEAKAKAPVAVAPELAAIRK